MIKARAAFLFVLATLLVAGIPAIGHAREVVDASAPEKLAVTVYRDPGRGQWDAMNIDLPRGFALISETRRVTLPAGESTIRFTGVAEGMIAVSAIVTGLPGGTIEKNRNAELLSPAALVNGMLGNRITVTRTNPGTGEPVSEQGVVRTRADGGLVLQTSQGYEAVRCAGLPERLTFPSIPAGLSPNPVFTIDTRDETGGTYDITLSYIAWGFDWQAHYVATLDEGSVDNKVRMNLMSWLTILNDNGQSFERAELMAVAGTLNIVSDFEGMAEPPRAEPLRLTCYPIGSTAAGSPIMIPSEGVFEESEFRKFSGDRTIVVTAQRRTEELMDAPLAMANVAMEAIEEQLGDLKLYRVPELVSVNAQGLKQVAFLNKQNVEGEFLYLANCNPWDRYADDAAQSAGILLATKNDEQHGLGVALPTGGFTLFEPADGGPRLVGEQFLRDYAVAQDVEIELGQSNQVFAQCSRTSPSEPQFDGARPWVEMKARVSNANAGAVRLRLVLGESREWEVRGARRVRLKDGNHVLEVEIPANGEKEFSFQLRHVA